MLTDRIVQLIADEKLTEAVEIINDLLYAKLMKRLAKRIIILKVFSCNQNRRTGMDEYILHLFL